jgi:methylmalonyl-CoA/ethylmalonyl-CoA epimerase
MQDPPPLLALHHIGVLVKTIDGGLAAYQALGARVSAPVTISSQGVRVCFVDLGGSVTIELVETMGNGLTQNLLKRGITYYHLGYLVADLDAALQHLVGLGYLHLQTFSSEAFDGRRCAFLMSPVLHLIEIIDTLGSPRYATTLSKTDCS